MNLKFNYLPETDNHFFAPDNQWLEDDPFPCWMTCFQFQGV